MFAQSVPDVPATQNLNEWLFLAALFAVVAALMIVARYLAKLVNLLAGGQLVPRDVHATEQQLTTVLAQVAQALQESAERERHYLEMLRSPQGPAAWHGGPS